MESELRREVLPNSDCAEMEAQTLSPRPRDVSGRLKRVLFILRMDPAGKFGSIEEQVLILAREFQRGGSLFLPVYMVPLDKEFAAQFAALGLEHETLDLSRFNLEKLHRLRSLIRRHRIDVVHWNFYDLLRNPYVWSLSVLNFRVQHYFTDHISRPADASAPTSRIECRSIVKRAAAFPYFKMLCVSDFVSSHARRYAGARAERIYYFVNVDRFRPDAEARREVRRTLGVEENTFVIVAVAHLIKDKGIDVLIRAMAESSADMRLWVVGQGPERQHLESLADEFGLRDRVRFLGSRRRVEPLLQAADCLVSPSVWAEAAGLVNLEALACGVPVVASRIGGIPELIDDGRTGILFSPGDHRELAGLLMRLQADEPGRLRMGGAARSTAVERFSPQCLLDEHLDHYRTDRGDPSPSLHLRRT